jgi:hypothetical protein
MLFRLALLGLLVPEITTGQSYCCDRPSEPDIPTGAFASYDEMQEAQDEVEQYMGDMTDYVECLRMEHDDATSEAEHVADNWEDEVLSFNNR